MKVTKINGTGDMAQVIGKCMVLNSNPSIVKKVNKLITIIKLMLLSYSTNASHIPREISEVS
jgi:hypothetical protein